MNERIQELANQILPHEKEFNKGDPKDWGYFFSAEELEDFVKLIVKECVQVGGPEDSYTDDWFKAKADSVAKIKKHFGVEE